MPTWKLIASNCLVNLNALTVNGVEVGFIFKPKDESGAKNAWRVFKGIGDDAKFVSHEWSKDAAKKSLEKSLAISK